MTVLIIILHKLLSKIIWRPNNNLTYSDWLNAIMTKDPLRSLSSKNMSLNKDQNC